MLLVTKLLLKRVDGVEPKPDFKSLFLVRKNKEFLCLFTLSLQGTDTSLELRKDIPKSYEIFLSL